MKEIVIIKISFNEDLIKIFFEGGEIMRYLDKKKYDSKFIKKALMPDAVRSSVFYCALVAAFVVLTVMIIDIIITGISNAAVLGTVASVICLGLFLYMIRMFSIPAIDYIRRVNCLMKDNYSVMDSVVDGSEVNEGRIYSMGPTIRSSSFTFKSSEGESWKLPQGRFRKPVVYSGQHAWLINYGGEKSFSMDYVLEPEIVND